MDKKEAVEKPVAAFVLMGAFPLVARWGMKLINKGKRLLAQWFPLAERRNSKSEFRFTEYTDAVPIPTRRSMNLKPRSIRFGVVVCLFAASTMQIAAQQKTEDSEQEDRVAKEIEQLESFTEMRAHLKKRMRAYSKRYRAAESKAERQEIFKTIPDSTAYNAVLSRFLKEASPEEAEKIVSWWWHGDRGKRDGELMADILLEHHADTEMLVKFIPRFLRTIPNQKSEEAFRTLIKNSRFDSVKATSMYFLQILLAEKAKTLDGEEAEALAEEAQSLRDSLKTAFAEETDLSGVTYAKRVDGAQYARILQIGKPVPDIVGTDLEGVEFKLSDYKGKVIILDFWGHW